MNKDKLQGIVTGVLLSTLAIGLGGTAAAGRNIEVSDGITITMNGVPFTPMDARGKEVPLFSYNGTTYAPVRALSEAAGLMVDYDATARVVQIETPDYAAALDPASSTYLTAEQARELALTDAGVTAAEAVFLKSHLNWEDGRAIYDVEFCAGQTEYDYELDAVTGAVLEKDWDCDGYDWSHHQGAHHSSGSSTSFIGEEAAKSAALSRLPGGTVRKCKLDQDDGIWCYELELYLDGSLYECKVDAGTGAIVEWERDD